MANGSILRKTSRPILSYSFIALEGYLLSGLFPALTSSKFTFVARDLPSTNESVSTLFVKVTNSQIGALSNPRPLSNLVYVHGDQVRTIGSWSP